MIEYLTLITISLLIILFIEYFYKLFFALITLIKIKFKFGYKCSWLGHLNSIQSGSCPFEFSNIRGKYKTVKGLRGNYPVIITADPKLIKNICTTYAGYFHSRMIEPLGPDSYSADNVHVFGARGERWKRIRTLTSYILKTSSLKQFMLIITEQTQDFINYLHHEIDTKTKIIQDMNNNYQIDQGIELNAHLIFQKLTATVIGRSALGLEKKPFIEESTHYKCFKNAFGNEPKITRNSETFQWIMPLSTRICNYFKTSNNDIKNPIEMLNDFISSILTSKIPDNNEVNFIQQFKNIEDKHFSHSKNYSEYGNIGYQNISKIKIKSIMSTDEIISQTRFLSIAGFDTTANTLTFALLLLADNHDKLIILLNEIDQFPNEFTYEDLSKAIYLHSVILETLRLFPHASMLQSRLCMEDCQMSDGTFIPKNTGILFDTWGMHYDTKYWSNNVNEFIPERHINNDNFPNYFTPFGVGQRQCVGMRFALMEIKTILIQFFKKFTVKLPSGISSKQVKLALRDTGTVWPYDVNLIFQLRSSCKFQ